MIFKFANNLWKKKLSSVIFILKCFSLDWEFVLVIKKILTIPDISEKEGYCAIIYHSIDIIPSYCPALMIWFFKMMFKNSVHIANI